MTICDCYSTLRCVSNLCSCNTSMQAGSLHLVWFPDASAFSSRPPASPAHPGNEPQKPPPRPPTWICTLIVQVAELASLAQLLPPCSPTVRNPAPDSSLKSCFSPIASASAAAHRLRSLQLLLAGTIAASASTAAPRLPPPPAAAPRLRPLQLLLARSTAAPRLHTGFQPMPCNGNVLEHSS